jgi:hypothetical protein
MLDLSRQKFSKNLRFAFNKCFQESLLGPGAKKLLQLVQIFFFLNFETKLVNNSVEYCCVQKKKLCTTTRLDKVGRSSSTDLVNTPENKQTMTKTEES